MTNKPDVRVFPSVGDVAHAAADAFVEAMARALRERGTAQICLAGGRTPKVTYEILADRDLPWNRVRVFFGDERDVPPDDENSNYRMAAESLISRAPVPKANVFRIPAELGAQAAADAYENTLRAMLNTGRFDLVFLGLGADAHTASLFPGSAALEEQQRWCVANRVVGKGDRITLTYPALNASRCVVFVATGREKAAALHDVLHAPVDVSQRPAQGVRPHDGAVVWLVDAAAAGETPLV